MRTKNNREINNAVGDPYLGVRTDMQRLTGSRPRNSQVIAESDPQQSSSPLQYDAHGLPAAIIDLDLSMVAKKIAEPAPEGKGWTAEMVAEAVHWYRRYLALIAKYGDEPLVPNLPIDTVWHFHILDTRSYARDCEAAFGRFLHHYPFFGLNGDAEERDDAFDVTNQLYRAEFGEDCREMRFLDHYYASANPQAQGCNHSGSGTGCGQRGGLPLTAVGQNCGHSGSGTGCGQGCSGGGKSPSNQGEYGTAGSKTTLHHGYDNK